MDRGRSLVAAPLFPHGALSAKEASLWCRKRDASRGSAPLSHRAARQKRLFRAPRKTLSADTFHTESGCGIVGILRCKGRRIRAPTTHTHTNTHETRRTKKADQVQKTHNPKSEAKAKTKNQSQNSRKTKTAEVRCSSVAPRPLRQVAVAIFRCLATVMSTSVTRPLCFSVVPRPL